MHLVVVAQVPVLDVLGVKQMLISLEKKTNKNQELRMKYADDPSKYVLPPRYRFNAFRRRDDALRWLLPDIPAGSLNRRLTWTRS
jgi:hypothetical protein